MKKVNPKLMIVYLFVLLSMTFSVWQLGTPAVFANNGGSGECCDTSSQCDAQKLCYDPVSPLRDCSPDKVGYCR